MSLGKTLQTQCLSPPRCILNGTGEFTAGCNPVMDYHPIQGGVEILPVASCYGNWDKLRPDGPLELYVTLPLPCLADYYKHTQCFKLKFFRSRLLATFFCKMVAARKILVAKNQGAFKAGHLMLPYMK